MQAHVFGVVILGYGNYGEDVKRRDGSVVEYVQLYDREASEDFTATLAPGLDSGRLPEFTLVDLTLDLTPTQKAHHDSDGRARVGRAILKPVVKGMKPSQAAANGQPPKEAAKA
ncbi:MAG: hypothetical protein JHC95_12590 [Solirubrobacteraceae bacterium]|nr:hypothetical protein [Solirubrobacteraceae bacterium]